MPTPVEHELSRPVWPPALLRGRRAVPDLSSLPKEEAERIRNRLAELDHACGCALGTAIALAVLAAYVAVLAFDWVSPGGTWVSIGVGAAVFVLGAGAGKTLGLMRARSRRNRLIDELNSRIGVGREAAPGAAGS